MAQYGTCALHGARGRVRGNRARALSGLHPAMRGCRRAARRGADRGASQPVTEVNFVNNCAEGLEIVRESGRRCVRLMPDLFHMNIEDASFHDALTAAREFIGYVDVSADSNRLAPGWGHPLFYEIFGTAGKHRLRRLDYRRDSAPAGSGSGRVPGLARSPARALCRTTRELERSPTVAAPIGALAAPIGATTVRGAVLASCTRTVLKPARRPRAASRRARRASAKSLRPKPDGSISLTEKHWSIAAETCQHCTYGQVEQHAAERSRSTHQPGDRADGFGREQIRGQCLQDGGPELMSEHRHTEEHYRHGQWRGRDQQRCRQQAGGDSEAQLPRSATLQPCGSDSSLNHPPRKLPAPAHAYGIHAK